MTCIKNKVKMGGGMLLGLLLTVNVLAQEKKKIEILGADVLRYKEEGGEKIKKLKGNVRLKHKSAILHCDSALMFDDDRQVRAGGNIHIEQDTVHTYGDRLDYNANTREAVLQDNVRLTNPRMELTTQKLTYNLDSKIAHYQDGGRLTDQNNELTSDVGHYHTRTNDVYFRHNVHLQNPDYTIDCDTLRYNTDTEIVYFLGPSTITSEENVIYCSYGWYDTGKDVSKFTKDAEIHTKEYVIKGDTLFYDRTIGKGRAVNNMMWRDTSGEMIITGDYGEYFEQPQRAMITQQPLLTSVDNKDSLFLTADTMYTYTRNDTISDTIRHYRLFDAFYGVKIFKESFQARCDSLQYSFADSTFDLYYDPVLWTNNTQMSGDTISVLTENNSIRKLDIYEDGFIINKIDSALYNQIKGDDMYGFFTQDTLRRLLVEGNGQSLYYPEDDSGRYLGLNEASSSDLIIRFKNNKVSEVTFKQQPEAVLHPMQQINPGEQRLEGFRWQEKRRPRSKRDLFNEPPPPE
jgi:lipopolysaccharide export system protein LptA